MIFQTQREELEKARKVIDTQRATLSTRIKVLEQAEQISNSSITNVAIRFVDGDTIVFILRGKFEVEKVKRVFLEILKEREKE